MKSNHSVSFDPAPGQGIVEAEILDVTNGRALRISDSDTGNTLVVSGHTSEVPALEVGDMVLATVTRSGVVVTGRLARPGEAPRAGAIVENGWVHLSGEKGVRLQCGESLIEMTHDGQIRLDGRDIMSIADGIVRVQGSTVELN